MAVVAALPEEAGALLRRLRPSGGRAATDARRRRLRLGRLAGMPVVVGVTGDGALLARRGLDAILARWPLEGVVVIGLAGALDPRLSVGDIVVGRRVRTPGGRVVLRLPPGEPDPAAPATDGWGTVVTVSSLASTPASKRALREALPEEEAAGSVVDLESAAYVAAAEAAGVPWTVLRAVSDAAHESLPGFLDRCRDGTGAIRRAEVLRQLGRRPLALPALLRLRWRAHGCAERLADATAALLSRWPAAAPVAGA